MSNISKNLLWCTNCLAMSTRPRISFDTRGWCNACVWSQTKKTLDWDSRLKELNALLNRHRRTTGCFDCIVPVSGGKDGSYVSYNLRYKYGMSPLAVTVTPPLPSPVGEQNLMAFIARGYNHISVNPDYEMMRRLNKAGFIEKGSPYHGWLCTIETAVIQMAVRLRIPLIFYGEDGEMEYGGSTETSNSPFLSLEYISRVWFEGLDDHSKLLRSAKQSHTNSYFFELPDTSDPLTKNIEICTWSYFENWDPYRNYLVAKEHCGLAEVDTSNSGTFTNFAQNDQELYALHTYLMYLKFGFGRANQDACIEIRRGAMDRAQAVNLVRLYDGQYPSEFIDQYLDYYQMNQPEFDAVLDRYANRDLFEKLNGRWAPKFLVS